MGEETFKEFQRRLHCNHTSMDDVLKWYYELRKESKKQKQSLENILRLSAKLRKKGIPEAEHLIRFCEKAGVTFSILREKELMKKSLLEEKRKKNNNQEKQ